jgi:predicted transcriptional regulator
VVLKSKMKTDIIRKTIGLDHPTVRKVIEIAENIMEKNIVLNIETLYNVAKKELKIPRKGLLFIIHYLIDKKVLIEGSKFSKDTVLLNRFRKKIYKFILSNPGVHFSYLRKKSISGKKISSGKLIWHLGMLIKFNYVKKIKVGNYSIFIPFKMEDTLGKLYFLMRDPINYKILKLIFRRKLLVKSEVYKEINEKREIVYYRINNLIDYEILITNPESEKELIINPYVKTLLSKILKSSTLKKE